MLLLFELRLGDIFEGKNFTREGNERGVVYEKEKYLLEVAEGII
jgi:hypothetical protein